jgi:hypothetical protein
MASETYKTSGKEQKFLKIRRLKEGKIFVSVLENKKWVPINFDWIGKVKKQTF